MKQKKNLLMGSLALLMLIMAAGCDTLVHQPLASRRATLGPETPVKRDLLELPIPKEPIVAAVYKFRDQTGQYKPSETGANWSTAVTQGATTILIRALEESGWFIPIERENISNLLNERKIIRSSRAQYEGDNGNGSLLPPLIFAGVILEGGIVSYESNVFTGGAGMRYFGADLSGQYREDRISIYLRAVSTANGKILKTVYTTKSILSQEVSAGFFRYVKLKRILEAETGFTYNEPTEICVTEAIEKAVESLIIEGVNDKLWLLDNPADSASNSFTRYEREKAENLTKDHVGRKFIKHRYHGKFGIGVKAGGLYYDGDYTAGDIGSIGTFTIDKSLTPNIHLEFENSGSTIHAKNYFNTKELMSQLNLSYYLFPFERLSPYGYIGGGAVHRAGTHHVGLSDKYFIPYASLGGGVEYLLNDNLAISGEGYFNYLLNDHYDHEINGSYNESLYGFKIGLKYYIK
ncbi:CsgG/HfaB family protein [Sunxiuqinia indica]|uniref:CsgG/HfaB family protein n=1 Tax=Sunxiuqinia indica TaxID=2692584 RepID=UPI001915779D|nr:CsgG/HfaB family protein [Sunxiuqinia indica]